MEFFGMQMMEKKKKNCVKPFCHMQVLYRFSTHKLTNFNMFELKIYMDYYS